MLDATDRFQDIREAVRDLCERLIGFLNRSGREGGSEAEASQSAPVALAEH